jgi:hypothetical protein
MDLLLQVGLKRHLKLIALVQFWEDLSWSMAVVSLKAAKYGWVLIFQEHRFLRSENSNSARLGNPVISLVYRQTQSPLFRYLMADQAMYREI